MIDSLKLDNQLCFPLYACSKEIIRKYKKYLDEIDLTYTQYIVMMVMWENKQLNISELGKKIYLDSGTLTPLLKKLETKGYINRIKNDKDERNLVITITKKGEDLKEEVKDIPHEISKCVKLSKEEAKTLYKLLYKMLVEEEV